MTSRTDLWNYPSSFDTSEGWEGFDVEAVDGSIGKVDESTITGEYGYLVVDTGFWIFGKKRMLPAGCITEVDRTNGKIHVSLTKEEVRNAPDHDELRRADRTYYDGAGEYYGPLV